MGHSSLLGLEHAAIEPAGRDVAALGPGDNSDSGSDRVGLEDVNTDDPVDRHPARRGVDAQHAGTRDIGVDRVVTPDDGEGGTGGDGKQHDDEDPDLAFIDDADGEGVGEGAPQDEDPEGRGLEDEGDNIPGGRETPPGTRPDKDPAAGPKNKPSSP